jgi:DNA polymerase sigma
VIPDAAFLFGSFVTKLALKTSNVDVTVLTGDITKGVLIGELGRVFENKPG